MAAWLVICYILLAGVANSMSNKTSSRAIQPPAKPVGQRAGKLGKTARTGQVPAVAQRGRLTLQQIKHAVDTALRGQTFEADAKG
jgi:hypothetical protein